MPNIKSAIKRVSVIEKKTARNNMIKSGYKSADLTGIPHWDSSAEHPEGKYQLRQYRDTGEIAITATDHKKYCWHLKYVKIHRYIHPEYKDC